MAETGFPAITEWTNMTGGNSTTSAPWSATQNWTTDGAVTVGRIKSPLEVIQSMPAQMSLYRTGIFFASYIQPVILVAGLVGNTLSLVVMLQRHNRRLSSCVYMTGLALADNGMILAYGSMWLRLLRFTKPGSSPNAECMSLIYFGMTFSCYGVLVVLAMTTERFIAVRFPFKAPMWCTPRRACITLAVLAFIVPVYNIPYAVYSRAGGPRCQVLTVKTPFSNFFSLFNLFLSSLVPFVLLITLNTFIIRTVRNRRKFFNKTETNSDQPPGGANNNKTAENEEKTARERQLTVMLLVVSFALLVLTLPQHIRFTILLFVDLRSKHHLHGEYTFANQFTNTLHILNNCINFFLYCISGSKFRRDLLALFGIKPAKSAMSRYASSEISQTTRASTTDISTISTKVS